jgi:hypothetical protein
LSQETKWTRAFEIDLINMSMKEGAATAVPLNFEPRANIIERKKMLTWCYFTYSSSRYVFSRDPVT